MESLKLGIFDIFTYLVPGGVVAFCLLLGMKECVCNLTSVKEMMAPFADTTVAASGIFCIYLIGIVCHLLSTKAFHWIRIYVWKKPLPSFSGLTGAELHVLLRQYSPSNFNYLEMYLALRGMSHSLAFAFGIGSVVSLFKCFQCAENKSVWIWGVLLSLFFALAFLFRARMFHEFYYDDGIAAVKKLNLKEKTLEGTST